MLDWGLLIPVCCGVVWLVARMILEKSDDPLVKKRMIRIQWAMVVVGIVTFMAYEGHHPGRDASTVPMNGSAE